METLVFLQALLNVALVTTLFLVSGGQFIASVVAGFIYVINWFKAHEIKARYKLFNEVFNQEYDEHLLIQAEMSVKGGSVKSIVSEG